MLMTSSDVASILVRIEMNWHTKVYECAFRNRRTDESSGLKIGGARDHVRQSLFALSSLMYNWCTSEGTSSFVKRVFIRTKLLQRRRDGQ